MGCIQDKADSHAENAECFYRKRDIPDGIFRRLEAGRPENRVAPIGECTLFRRTLKALVKRVAQEI